MKSKAHYHLIFSLGFGALLGVTLHSFETSTALVALNSWILEPVGQLFLRLIFMIVVPMVFSGLVLGITQLSQSHGIGRIVGRTLAYTVLASAASVLIGITLVNLIKPGGHFTINTGAANTEKIEQIQKYAQSAKPLTQVLLEFIPKNPFAAAVNALDGEMLSLMFFALIFGWALSRSSKNVAESKLVHILEEIYNASLTLVHSIMKLAPFAVFCLVFSSTFKFGHQLLISLASYVFVVVFALLIQQYGVYSLLLKLFTHWSPWDFFRKCKDVYIYAFATASSNATLPKSLDTAENILKLDPAASRFVLTVGSTANQNGTALFEGITVLFLAQVYQVDLTLLQQFQVILMSILAGIGTAGVPGGSLPLIMILLNQMGIPAEGMGLILGVDRFLDMCRTTINVSGDLVIAALVDPKKGHTADAHSR